MDQEPAAAHRHYTTLWEERRVVAICFIIAFGQFQYGYDSAAIAGFQSMVGFLQIFGYADVTPLHNFHANVSLLFLWVTIFHQQFSNLFNHL